jgi:hypothetical protein
MAHFAQVDKDNKVIQVVVIDNDYTHDENGVEQEALGIAYCKSLFGADTKWLQTSYNASIRHKFAGVGDTYLEEHDRFVPSNTTGFASWVLGKDFTWEAPVPFPTTGGTRHKWNEEKLAWEAFTDEVE